MYQNATPIRSYLPVKILIGRLTRRIRQHTRPDLEPKRVRIGIQARRQRRLSRAARIMLILAHAGAPSSALCPRCSLRPFRTQFLAPKASFCRDLSAPLSVLTQADLMVLAWFRGPSDDFPNHCQIQSRITATPKTRPTAPRLPQQPSSHDNLAAPGSAHLRVQRRTSWIRPELILPRS